MEIPIEVLIAIITALSGALGGIFAYIKKQFKELDDLRKTVRDQEKRIAVLETEKRLSSSHGSKADKIMEEAKEYERKQIIEEYKRQHGLS